MKLKSTLVLFLLALPVLSFGQSSEQFFSDLNNAWRPGNSQSLIHLLDDELELTQNGREGSYSREQAGTLLLRFLETHQPNDFKLKHKGSSNDGQIYAIGQLETRGGRNYKIICRARSWQSGYKIIKLDLVHTN